MNTKRHQIPGSQIALHSQTTNISMKSGMYSDYLGLTFEHPPGDWRHGVTLTGIEATARPLGTPQRQNGLAIAIDHPIKCSTHA
tara:strand:+ start:2267 stop:2518 length:252 start_codon:yes stop_codon:yes gene_type:complete